MTHRLVKLVRGALLPTTLPQTDLNLYGGWENKTELTGAWLTQIIHTVRFSLCLNLFLIDYVQFWYLSMPAIPLNGFSLSLSAASAVSHPGVAMMLCLPWRSPTICCRWSRICCWRWEFTASWWLFCTLQKVGEDSVSWKNHACLVISVGEATLQM